MEKAVFEKELNKYKIVRLADHYKIRWKLQKVQLILSVSRSFFVPCISVFLTIFFAVCYCTCCSYYECFCEQKSVPKSLPSSSATSSPILESGVDMSFWPMIERVNVNAVASEAEMKKFMDALREEYNSGMQAHVNLQDLDYMASKL